MIKLYHCRRARSFRPLWMLEELGLSYDLVMLPFPPRAREKRYLDINPLGTVPAFFDGDEVPMTESAAICQYLVTRYGPTDMNVGADDADYGAFLNWLHFGEATLTFPQTLVLRYSQLEPEERRQPQVAEDYAKWFAGRLRIVESTLASRDYLCADRFTAADVSVGYALMLAESLGLDACFHDHVKTYWARLKARDAFASALNRQDTETLTLESEG